MIQKIKTFDWKFIQTVSFNSVAIIFGRIFGFAFTFIIARAFSTDDFGYITYIITLGTIVALLSQPFGQHVVAYFIGKYKDNPVEYKKVMSNVWGIALFLLGLTLVISIIVFQRLGLLSIELLILYLGFTLFYTYYGIASGFLASSNLSYAYIGSNVFQTILVIAVVYIFNIRSTSLIITIYGFSYFLPLLLLQIYLPLQLQFRLSFDIKYIIEIARVSFPILLSHTLYVGYTTAGIIIVSWFMNDTAIGLFGFTRTLVSVFVFIPNGFTWLLMPKIASMKTGRTSIVLLSIATLTVVNIIGIIIFLGLYEWFVLTFFGVAYFLNIEFVVILVMGTVLGGYHGLLTATFVGIGKPEYQTLSQIAMLFVVLFAGITLIPTYNLIGAAIMQLSGIIVGLGIYIIFIISTYRKRTHKIA